MEPGATPRRARPRRADGRATRERIESTAADRFATSGYNGTSLRQIATGAGVDLATLKYHFGTKPELFSEVYRAGHAALIALLVPLTRALSRASTVAELEAQIERQVRAAAAWLEDNERWVRMTLFRLLEQPAESIPVEDALQLEMLAVVDGCLVQLRDRGLIRPTSSRSLVVMIVTAFPAWFLCARARPAWVGLPESGAGLHATFTTFFTELLRQHLLLH